MVPQRPFLNGKPRLRPVQRLDLALLVEGEHDRPLRRVHVQPHHVAELLHELRIGGELEGAHPVGLQPVRPPDPRHLAVVEPGRLRHQPRAPVRPPRRLLLQRPAHDLRLDLRRDPRSGAAPPGPVLQSGQTLGLVPVQPALDGRQRDADLQAQGARRQAAGRAEDDPGALSAPLRGRAGPNPALELLLRAHNLSGSLAHNLSGFNMVSEEAVWTGRSCRGRRGR